MEIDSKWRRCGAEALGASARPGELAGLEVAAQVAVIAGDLASDEALDQRPQEAQRAAQFALGQKRHAGAIPVGLEAPRAVDRLRALDHVDPEPARPLEFRELRDLLEFPGAARRLRALAEATAPPGRAGRE